MPNRTELGDVPSTISPLQRALDELEASILDARGTHRVLADALENGIASPGTPPTRSEAHGHRASAYTLGERFEAVREAVRAALPAPAVAARAADLLGAYPHSSPGTASAWIDQTLELLREIVAARIDRVEPAAPYERDRMRVAALEREVAAGHVSATVPLHVSPLETRVTSQGERPRHLYDAAERSRYCKWCNEEEYHPVHIARAGVPTPGIFGLWQEAPPVRDQHWVSAIKHQDAIKRDVEQGLTSAQIRDEIIGKVGMMASARTPEMQARYDAALEREKLDARPDPTQESVDRQVAHDLAVTAARMVIKDPEESYRRLFVRDLVRMAEVVLAHAGEGPVTPPARTLTEQQLAKALSCSVDEWCKSVADGTLFDLWCSYVGVTANTYENALAYGAFRAARDYFSTKAHQRREPAEIVYTAPAPKAEASPDLQTAIGEMDSGLNALVNELAPDVVQNLRTRFEDVLRHVNNQLLKPSHELEALRNFHENVTERLRSIRQLDSSTKRSLGLARLEDDALTNNGQALMKPRQLDAIGVTVSGTNPPIPNPNLPNTATFVETPQIPSAADVIRARGGGPLPEHVYTAGPPPDGRPVAEHLAELANGPAVKKVIDMARRVVSRGIHRRRTLDEMLRGKDLNLLHNDLQGLIWLAEAVEKLDGAK